LTDLYDTGFPDAPFADPTGQIMPVWRRFLMTLWFRTGQAAAPAVGAPTDLSGRTPIVVSPTGSPFTLTPPCRGTLFVSGGGVEAMTIRRKSGTAYPVGGFYGGITLTASDTLTVTYLTAPTMVFFPS
jgi:hypothetical protein